MTRITKLLVEKNGKVWTVRPSNRKTTIYNGRTQKDAIKIALDVADSNTQILVYNSNGQLSKTIKASDCKCHCNSSS